MTTCCGLLERPRRHAATGAAVMASEGAEDAERECELSPPALHLIHPLLHPQSVAATSSERSSRKKEGIIAAAAAAEIKKRLAEQGLACKICEQVFRDRKSLLKHIQKTGHVRDPSTMHLPKGCSTPEKEDRMRLM